MDGDAPGSPGSGRKGGKPSPPPADGDPIVRGVAAGGQVVDDWIRQAQQAARMMGTAMPNGNWPDASSRMFRAASDMMASWMAIVAGPLQGSAPPWFVPPSSASSAPSSAPSAPSSAATPASAPVSGSAAPENSAPSPTQPARAASDEVPVRERVRLEVSSRRAVALSLDVHRNGTQRFRVLDLRSEDGSAPRIGKLELTHGDSDWLTLRVSVPDDQPAGTYHAVVLDAAADCAIGTVTLRILE